jgi:predicted TIM-barrel fold metal-dependent hydrolase
MDVDGMNAFIAREVKDKLSRALMIAPSFFSAKKIETTLELGGFSGFKPYMCLSKNKNTVQSTILQMLPEHYWKIANERKLIILLHIGRYRSLADPVNQKQIRALAEKYPRVKLQLAHCARCFTPEIAEKGLSVVADLPNVHLDTSAVCDTEVFHILFDVWPLEKILFGTDNVGAGMERGKITTFGYGWYTVNEHNTTAFSAPHVPARPTFLAYENLRAIRYAARRKKWGRQEREDFFWNNAARIFGLGK